MASPGFALAAIGLNHGHIYGQVDVMLTAGCRLKSFHAPEDSLAAAFSKKYPDAKRIADERAILDDPEIRLVVGAGILDERAPMAVRAMRHGKDVMLDKPGATTLDQLAELRRVQAETGRIFSILYSEHYTQPATVAAGELVKSGAIGRVLQTVGLGPHKVGNYQRPDWFWSRERTGGILCDIGSHQVEQFLFFTGAERAEIAASHVANFDHPQTPEFEDFGQMLLTSDDATGFIRVDWFTQDGLPTWGDGRLFILGTEGTIELRKYIDTAGRAGTGSSLPGRPRARPAHRLHQDEDHVRRAAPRRRAQPHRNRNAATSLLLCDRVGACCSGESEAACRKAAAGTRRMTRTLTVGVVGAGVGVNHITAYRELGELYSVEALCDIDGERAGNVAAEHGIAKVVTELDSLLGLGLDIIDVCTPSSLHFSQARQALLAGHHAVVEKPFASSLVEADALAELEQQSGKRVSPIFQYRFSNGIAQLLHLDAGDYYRLSVAQRVTVGVVYLGLVAVLALAMSATYVERDL